jgi:hypothetical protein
MKIGCVVDTLSLDQELSESFRMIFMSRFIVERGPSLRGIVTEELKDYTNPKIYLVTHEGGTEAVYGEGELEEI